MNHHQTIQHHISSSHHGNHTRAFAVGVGLNLLFVFVEASYGLLADSLALLADAGHNLSDVASLLLAWGASVLATKAATDRRTYGYRKVTIMASLASAILLLVAIGGIAWESLNRLATPAPVKGETVIIVAAIGVVINTLTALLFLQGQQHDLNIRGAFLHMAADAAVSLGVVIAGLLIMTTSLQWIDPVVSLVIVVVIFIGTWGLLRDSLNYAMDAVPKSVDLGAVRHSLGEFERVVDIHDLHIWPLSTTETALTVHLLVDYSFLDNDFLNRVQQHLRDHFNIAHSTIQVETCTGNESCLLDKSDCSS